MKGHWKKQFNYEYLGSYSLDGKKEILVTVNKLAQEKVTGQQGRKEDCFVVYFNEFDKGMILNRTNARAIEKVAGSGLVEDWKGTQVTLYVEKGVKAFGDVVDALRIRDKKVVLKQMTDDVVEKMEFAIKNGGRDQVEMALSKYNMTDSQKQRMAKLLFTPIMKK
tara:strand:- start:5370 stop:5864 length:495 start_codon:yes stop_codon:yes gene_type:complete